MIGNDQRRMHRTGGVNAAVRGVQVEQGTFARAISADQIVSDR